MPLVNRPVADGIRKTEELINLALSGHEASRAAGAKPQQHLMKVRPRWCLLQHLMSGASQMLPFVIGGGIMIARPLIDGAFGVPQDSLAPGSLP